MMTKNTIFEIIHGAIAEIPSKIFLSSVYQEVLLLFEIIVQHTYEFVLTGAFILPSTKMKYSNDLIFTLYQSNICNKQCLNDTEISQNSFQVGGFLFCPVAELMGFCFHRHIHFLCKQVLFKHLIVSVYPVAQLLKHPFRSNNIVANVASK